MIISRRNIDLAVMTAGPVAGMLALAFAPCALWAIVPVMVQVVRYIQALARSRRGPLGAWLG